MTEKEALRRLEIHKSWGLSNRLNEAMCVATQALKEIQQYREIGTVEDIRDLLIVISEGSDNANEDGIDLEIIKNLIELKHYRVIGTVEECREAREKQKAKKPIIGADFMVDSDDNGEPIWEHDYICSECGLGIAGEYICCPYCGTYIDWSEEE